MVFTCCVPNCKKTTKQTKMHRFPYADVLVYNRWINNIGRQDLQGMEPRKVYNTYRVCDEHFLQDVKIDPEKYSSKSYLMRGACPTLFMPRPLCEAQAASSTVTTAETAMDEPVRHEPEGDEQVIASVQPTEKPMNVDETIGDGSVGALEGEQVMASAKPTERPMEVEESNSGGGETTRGSVGTARTRKLLHPALTPSLKRRGRKDVRKRLNLLQAVQLTRSAQLTPRAKSLYVIARDLKQIASDLDRENVCVKERLEKALDYAESEAFFRTKMNKTSVQFLMSQLKLQKKEPKGRRYTTEDKIFALSLLKQSPRGYKLLQKVFALPSRKTVNQLLRRVPFKCGLNDGIMNALQQSTNKLPTLDRYAVLMWDEVSLDTALTYNARDDRIIGFADAGTTEPPASIKIADHAMVFMLRGIRRKWKQPLAYFFSDSSMNAADLKRNVKSIIRATRAIGINVVATISDQMATNGAVIKSLLEDTTRWCAHNGVENRYCGYLVDGQEVVHLYDPPHLLKCIRNMMLEYDVKFRWKSPDEQVARWADVIHLYEADRRQEDDFKLCSRLTDEHVYKEKMRKMKVKLAAQVFSHRVASIMNAVGSKEHNVPGTYCGTSAFLKFMDNLFDSVNGAVAHPVDGKLLRTAISDTSAHLQFWDEALPVLDTLRFFSTTKKAFVPPCVSNWKKTIQGLKYVWGTLRTQGFKFLSLRNFNQDPLENFFSSIRSHGRRNINPNVAAFQASFKSLVINNFTTTHSPGSNCETDDTDGALNSLRSFLDVPDVEGVRALPPDLPDDSTFRIQNTQNTLKIQLHAYLAGYVAKKLLQQNCTTCRRALLTGHPYSPEHGLTQARAYNPRALKYVSCSFRELFSQSCQVLHHFLPKYCHHAQLGVILRAKVQQYVLCNFQNLLLCKVHNVLNAFVHIFVKFYIFTWTKHVNQILKGKDHSDLNDTVKLMAFTKYNKKRGRLAKIKQIKGLV